MQIFFTNISFAATTCPVTFSKEFKVGEEDESIYVLQQILNSDKRTVIAISGVGSTGKETGYFGAATKKALKRFQALFIEYIGVADGVLNERTRVVLQNVCERKAEGGIDVGQISNNLLPKKSETELQKNIGGKIILRLSTQQKVIERQEQLKIALEVNAEDLKIDPEVFIVEGGSVQSIRKLGKLSYLILIGAEESANSISVQIEADRIKDANGNTNEEASNEIIVKVTGSVAQQTQTPGIIDRVTDNLSDILGRITGEIKTKNCNGIDITTSGDCPGTPDYSTPNNQNSATANNPAQQSGSGGEQGQQAGGQPGGMGSQISQMLSGLLGSLGGKGGGGQGPNGQGGDGQRGGQGPGDQNNGNGDSGVQSSGENIQCGEGDFSSDQDARAALRGANVEVGDVSTLAGLPKKIVMLLGRLKVECNCAVVVTGGTNAAQHKTHGPGKPVVDIRTRDEGQQLVSYIRNKFPQSPKSHACMNYAHNVYGAIFNFEGSGCGNPHEHWHVEAQKFACQ